MVIPAIPAAKKFVVDSMLGKLAKWLRVLGFDARYERISLQAQLDDYLARGYLLLTRNTRWCGQCGVFCLKANDPGAQLREVVSAVPIERHEIRPLDRCLLCNEPLIHAERSWALGHVPDYVFANHTVFHQCPSCLRFYWPGSHPHKISHWLESALGWSLETCRAKEGCDEYTSG